jgi:hypothetical protein
MQNEECRMTNPPDSAYGRIPPGFRLPAQGCEERATLGHHRIQMSNRNAVAAASTSAAEICHNPIWVGSAGSPLPQRSSFLATLGWLTQSLRDWKDCRLVNPAAVSCQAAGPVSPSPWGEGRDEGGRRSLSICFKNRAALRAIIYSVDLPAQAAFPTSRHP